MFKKKSDEGSSAPTSKERKPFYKKKWFIVIAGLVILGAIFGGGDDGKEDISSAPKNKTGNKVEQTSSVENEKKEEVSKEVEPEIGTNEFVDKYKSQIGVAVENWIEETERQKMKGFAPSTSFDYVTYSSDVIRDNEDEEYPISVMVTGEYEGKADKRLYKFMMVLGYKTKEDVENFNSYLLQYVNEDSGNMFNAIHPEDDALTKLMEATKEQ